MITVHDEYGRVIQRRVIAEDHNSDLLLIEGLPDLKGLDIAKSAYATEHVRTFTRGAMMDTYKSEGELIQKQEVQILRSIITSSEEEAACLSMPKYKAVNVDTIIGSLKFCILDLIEVVSNAQIVPGSSGGMVVDDSGRLVGVASASGNQFYFFVTLSDIRTFLAGY